MWDAKLIYPQISNKAVFLITTMSFIKVYFQFLHQYENYIMGITFVTWSFC